MADAGLAPDPKFHAYKAPALPLPVYVVFIFTPSQTEAGMLNVDVGVSFTVTFIVVTEDVNPASVTLKVTTLAPGVDHVIVCGPAPVPGLAVPPPKFHM
jgi:hypothetical protein